MGVGGDPAGEDVEVATGEGVGGSTGEVEGLSSMDWITSMQTVPLCVSTLSVNPGRHSHV